MCIKLKNNLIAGYISQRKCAQNMFCASLCVCELVFICITIESYEIKIDIRLFYAILFVSDLCVYLYVESSSNKQRLIKLTIIREDE